VKTKKKTARTAAKPRKLVTTGISRENADRIAGDIIDNALARSKAREKPSENDAAVAIARSWLTEGGFHEDPSSEDPARIEIKHPGWDGKSQEHYVDVRIYVPAIDIEHVVAGKHPDVTLEAAP
jgi:hypothetical protein